MVTPFRLNVITAFVCLHLFFSNDLIACGYNFVSACGTQLSIKSNGQSSTYYVANCTWLTNFNNFNFGTVTDLSLESLNTQSWESCTNNVIACNFYYRIYASGQTPGNFITVPISTLTTTVQGDYRNRYYSALPGVDLLAGLTSGTNYVMEVYFRGDVDTDGNNVADAFLTVNNSGTYYKATFKKGGTAPGAITVNMTNKTNVTCFGGNDGSVTAVPASGVGPFTYIWSNGATTATIANLPAGSYTCTVTSSTASTGSANVSITQPAAVSATLAVTNETSATANNGAITATPSGGTGPYTYLWSNAATTATITNLDAGSYSVTVHDSKACTGVQTASVQTNGTAPPGTYCTASGTIPWNEWIGQVTLGTLNNTSDKAVYSNFTALVGPELTMGESYPLIVKTGTGWFASLTFFRAWIDYNHDGIFQDTEIAFTSQIAPPISGFSQLVTTNDISIPVNAVAGATRMRIAIKRTEAPTACETFTYGEVEDYTVNLLAPSGTCSISAAVSNIVCNNNATNAVVADDKFTCTLLVTASGGGTGWSTVINGTTITGTYGTAKNLGPYLISGGNLSFSVNDNTEATCRKNVTVIAPLPCSSSGTTLSYCASKADFPWHEWISKVTFSGINNISGKSQYSDFTTVGASVTAGNTYPISIYTSFSWEGGPEYYRVWIDYNEDGIFQEPGEIAYSGFYTTNPPGAVDFPISGNIVIPTTAVTGLTRMRVSLKKGGYATPCEALIPYGEVEDYVVNIAAGVAGNATDRQQLAILEAEQGVGKNIVKLSAYNAEKTESIVLVHSTDGILWSSLREWNNLETPGMGGFYEAVIDENPAIGNNYYRAFLRLPFGGVLETNVARINNQAIGDFAIFPNPVYNGNFNIELSQFLGEAVEIGLFNQLGVLQQRIQIPEVSELFWPMDVRELASGDYLISIKSATHRPVARKIMVINP